MKEIKFDTRLVIKTEINPCLDSVGSILYENLPQYQYYLIIDDRLINRIVDDKKISYFSIGLNDFTIPVLTIRENFKILKEKVGIIIVRKKIKVNCMLFSKNIDSFSLEELEEFEIVRFAGEIKDIFDAHIIIEEVDHESRLFNNPQRVRITLEKLFEENEIITITNDYIFGYDVTKYLLSK